MFLININTGEDSLHCYEGNQVFLHDNKPHYKQAVAQFIWSRLGQLGQCGLAGEHPGGQQQCGKLENVKQTSSPRFGVGGAVMTGRS